MTAKEFAELLPALVHDGFPQACPITGNFDLMAIDAWQDRRSGLAGPAAPPAAVSADIVRARLATLG
ncbi:hypothetical protein [Mesorhizobium sp. M0522]|uniref:hypothetical protein n=1 Tax=Mesorhizobium sp. M0522 TaxID=2956958 RepID=UPI0033386D31